MVGNRHRPHRAGFVAPLLGEHAGHGRHFGRRADIAHHGFVPDAHPQDVVAAEVAVLAPVQRGLGVDEGVGAVAAPVVVADPQAHRQDFAQVAVADVFDDGLVHFQGLGGGDDLRY